MSHGRPHRIGDEACGGSWQGAADHDIVHGRSRASSGIGGRPSATARRVGVPAGLPGGRSATRRSRTNFASWGTLVMGIVMVVMGIVEAVMVDTMKDRAIHVVLRNYVFSRHANYVAG